MTDVQKISEKIKKNGRGVTYMTRSFSMSPSASKIIDKVHERLVKHAEARGIRRPTISDVMNYFILRNKISPKDFFK